MRLMTAALALVVTTPRSRRRCPNFPFQFRRNASCLLEREGVPTVYENKYQATKAKIKLAGMSEADPLVRGVRRAVHRAPAGGTSEQLTPETNAACLRDDP